MLIKQLRASKYTGYNTKQFTLASVVSGRQRRYL